MAPPCHLNCTEQLRNPVTSPDRPDSDPLVAAGALLACEVRCPPLPRSSPVSTPKPRSPACSVCPVSTAAQILTCAWIASRQLGYRPWPDDREAAARLLGAPLDAGSCREAVEQAQDPQSDVVLMDIRMPGTDGITATRRIVGKRGSAAAPWVLLPTTFDLDEYVLAGLEAGASGFLTEDTDPPYLGPCDTPGPDRVRQGGRIRGSPGAGPQAHGTAKHSAR